MSNDIAISVKNVSKAYRIWRDPSARLKAPLWEAWQKLRAKSGELGARSYELLAKESYLKKLGAKSYEPRATNSEQSAPSSKLPAPSSVPPSSSKYYKDFYALNGVSFTVKKGEAVGIIGRNGSGKSTLLQMIAGTLTPTSGTIKVHGRVAALLELGSGFNPDFTGRENVYLNASVLGLTKEEIDARYKEIADFADIGDFIEQPVKTYSSGMTMRLAFAVIANIDADVLIIDEAFAVGDVFFQQKCMRFLREFQQKSGTLLFVSHDMCAVTRLCQQAVLLTRQGEEQSMFVDSAETISKRYLGKIYEERADTLTHTESVARRPSAMSSSVIQEYKAAKMETSWIHISPFRHDAESFGQNGGNIIGACFTDNSDHPLTEAQAGEIVKLVVTATTRKPMTFPAFGFIIKDRTGQYIIAESTDIPLRKNQIIIDKPAQIKTTFKFRMPTLIRGEYTVNLAFAEGPGDEHVQHHWIHDAISLKSTDKRLVHGLFGAQDMEISVVVKASQ